LTIEVAIQEMHHEVSGINMLLTHDKRYLVKNKRNEDTSQNRKDTCIMQQKRIAIGILASGLLLIGLALAYLLGAGGTGHLFFPILFTGLAFATLLGSIGTMSPQGIYGGIQGFFWLLGLAFCFLVGFWPWILVVVGFSVLLGTLYAPIISGLTGMALVGPPSGSNRWYQD
jgi:hypothetical protein